MNLIKAKFLTYCTSVLTPFAFFFTGVKRPAGVDKTENRQKFQQVSHLALPGGEKSPDSWAEARTVGHGQGPSAQLAGSPRHSRGGRNAPATPISQSSRHLSCTHRTETVSPRFAPRICGDAGSTSTSAAGRRGALSAHQPPGPTGLLCRLQLTLGTRV